ncbi:MAG: diaminopimelate epimerase [Bacteroidia bacterium]
MQVNMTKVPFVKYHGTGNDFVLLDERETNLDAKLDQQAIARICHRHFGIGADGLMRLKTSEAADFKMLYYNADGNESSLCGNGSRCIVAFAKSLGIISDSATFETSDGTHQAWVLENDHIKLKMHSPHGYRQYNTSTHFIDTGSPHHVAVVDEQELSSLAIIEQGSKIRYSESYKPDGTNVNFMHEAGSDNIHVRTYERGVENETLSCGTGVTACAYVHLIRSEASQGDVRIHTPGGELTVSIKNRGLENEEVYLIGPAQHVFTGLIAL